MKRLFAWLLALADGSGFESRTARRIAAGFGMPLASRLP